MGAEPQALRHSPLEAAHERLGASFIDFAGWRLPRRFTSETEEHLAVRERCGLFDISHMGQLVVTGAGAGAALSYALVSDPSGLRPGAAQYSMLCDERGGVLDDLIVYRRAETEFLVIANAANTATVLAELAARSSRHGVAIHDETDSRALVALQGPRALTALRSWLGDRLAPPPRFHLLDASLDGRDVVVARTGYTGEDGVELSVRKEDAEWLWGRLLAAAADEGGLPAGLVARDTLRMEAGLPLYGHELDPGRSPFDAGFGRIVDLGHDFVGGDALRARAESLGEVRLVGLRVDGRRVPRQGCAVKSADGRPVGVVTSGGPSPTLGVPIALAYVSPEAGAAGSQLEVDIRGHLEAAVVVPLPFVRGSASGVDAAAPSQSVRKER